MEGASRYRATRLIGRGGAADVYDAIATGVGGFQRRVVLKRLRRENAPDASLARGFIDEARIISQLHHANIVSVLDFGLADGLPFQVLELVDGVDLATLLDLVKRPPGPPIEVSLFIAGEIAHALAYAHSAEDFEGQPLYVVHRDVTPGNILISWSGDVKLADFGIARATKRLEATAIGYAKGKLEYMSPEQARADEVDGRADLFSLGCVLHQLVAGASPLATLEARREVDMFRDPPLSPSLPEDVRAIVERAMRPAPSSRFADAETMEREIGNALTRRARADARTMLRDLLTTLKGPVKKRAPNEAAELFDVELVMRGSGDRRFESRVISATSIGPPPMPTASVMQPIPQPPPMPSPSSDPSEDDPMIGSILDSYRLVSRLGAGGMARVYRAQHLVVGNEVAIKILHGHASAWSQKRFRREAEAMSRVHHPHVVKIVDFGATPSGVPFLVMEMLQGQTLKRAIRESGPMSLERALALGRDLASGLEAIHAHGIIHRDLKPANVMLTGSGAKILDFGIALVSQDQDHGETRFTVAQQLLGTPAYMAPEQIESAKAVDERADLYALGALLYFASAGRAPFTGNDRDILDAKPHVQPPTLPPSSGLERVVAALLSPSPDDRPPTASEVLDRLRAIDIDTTVPLSDHEEDDSEAATPATRVTEVDVPIIDQAAVMENMPIVQSPTVTAIRPDTALRVPQLPPRARSWAIAGLMLLCAGLMLAAAARLKEKLDTPMEIIATDIPNAPPAAKQIPSPAKARETAVQPAEELAGRDERPGSSPFRPAAVRGALKTGDPEPAPAEELAGAQATKEPTKDRRTNTSQIPRLKSKLDTALTAAGMQLDELDPTLVELWQRAIEADDTRAANTALDRMLDKIARAELTEEALLAKLQKVSRALKAAADRLSSSAYEPLEARYLDLRANVGNAADARARRKLARAIDTLERDIDRAH